MMISTSYFKVFNVFIYFGVAIYDVLVYIILVNDLVFPGNSTRTFGF
jgi:hypothetical protein